MQLVVALAIFIVANAPKLVGFVLPPVVEFLNKDVQNDNARFIISLVVCLLAAVALDWNQVSSGNVDQTQLTMDIGIIFLESQSIFKLYFQQSWLRGKIQTVISSVNAPTERG